MPEKNKRYLRTAPNGDESVVFIKTDEEEKYQRSYLENGFKFKEIVPIAARGSVCESCEG